jgi:deoxyhypusine synthase
VPFFDHQNTAVMAAAAEDNPPSGATAAVLKPSEPVPEEARRVRGIDFNDYAQRSITVEELVGGMANMGFQATSVGQAVRIINDMVSPRREEEAREDETI